MVMPALTPRAVLVIVEDPALSVWVARLCETLETSIGVRVSLAIAASVAHRHPALESLLSLEKTVLRKHRPCWADRVKPDALDRWTANVDDTVPDVVVDLTAAQAGHHDAAVLQPLFNGQPGEFGLASALFFEGTPQIDITCRVPGSDDRFIVGQGVASLEAAAGLGGAMEAVWSRVLMLLVKILSAPGLANMGKGVSRLGESQAIGSSKGLVRSSKMLAHAAIRAIYALCCHAPHWRVGWRRSGPHGDVWSRRDLGGSPWTILRDPIDHFYADPFPFRWKGRDFLFFEDLDHKTAKGIISVVEIDENNVVGPVVPVLEEPWHLSYPFLIEADGEIWMIPEASLSGEISIYRAKGFPFAWERHSALVSGVEAADATIVEHNGKFWMFAVVRNGVGGYSDTLALWHSDTLFGPWQAHAANPVLIHDQTARPAGHFVSQNGQLLRPVQDCRRGYGASLGLARITRLDEAGFDQQIETHLAPGPHWPGRKLHTLNGNGHLEAIDGSILRPKIRFAADWVDRLNQPS